MHKTNTIISQSFAETGRFRELQRQNKKGPLSSATITSMVLNYPTGPLLLSQIWQQNYQDEKIQTDWK